MAQPKPYTLRVKLDNCNFYQSSGWFYYTGKTLNHYIENNEIVIEKHQRLRIKFNTKIRNFDAWKILEHGTLILSFSKAPEQGSNAYTSATVEPDEIVSYEDRIRTISPTGLSTESTL